jgi:hypothetical protein
MNANLYRSGRYWVVNTGITAHFWNTAKAARLWAQAQKLKLRRAKHFDFLG